MARLELNARPEPAMPGRRARWALPLSLVTFVCAASLFYGIAEQVLSRSPLTLMDVQVSQWFHAHATPKLTQWMLVITHLHEPIAVGTYVVVAAAILAWKRDWYWLVCLAATVPTGMVLNALMKLDFHRARPNYPDSILTLSSYGFPSGHVVGATLLYGVLTAMLVTKAKDLRKAVVIVLTGISLVALVALTRVYLLVHYLSDVVAAFSAALAWLMLCLVGIHALSERRRGPSPVHQHDTRTTRGARSALDR